jgi:GGDEF domain-containing protein
MSMSPDLRPLHVLVVSTDVSLLHEVAWVLEAVGHSVHTTSDLDQNALWRRYSLPDFVIVDSRDAAEPTANIFAHDSDNPHYRIFLYDLAKGTDLSAWYAAGAHDALRIPVSRGELLARTRTGARFLEFERRLRHRSSYGDVTGVYSRRGLLRKLQKMATSDDPGMGQHTLIATSIEWYDGIRRKSGETASEKLVSRAARAIRRATGENAICAYLGDGRFATLLLGQPTSAAKSAAESLAKDFGSRESLHESAPRPTLTCAVMPWGAGSKADRLLNDALELLKLAEHSGGDCVVLHGDFSRERTAWQEEITTGNPFANVVAQDIMEPFPALLEHNSQQPELADALQRANVPVRPYVDRDGRLVGIATDVESAAELDNGHESSAVGETLATPQTIPHDATFSEIYETFTSRVCAALVVVAGDQPLGYITCDGFLSMIDPIHADLFAQTDKHADELRYLLVPSRIDEPAAVPAEA